MSFKNLIKLFFVLVLFLTFILPVFLFKSRESTGVISPLGNKTPGPLSIYSFENLAKRKYEASSIKPGKIIKKDINFTSFLFFYESDGKKISGLLNLPAKPCPSSGCPVIVLLRGYVDQEIYYTGMGTQKAGEFFAKNGYITLAPDFLGYGSSDPQLSTDILEDRFQKPVEVLNLLASIRSSPSATLTADPNRIGIWGHSNGGQIAISVLEISRETFPTVLWAPVTRGFPESLTDYMHVLDDQGKKVKAAIDKFSKDYDVKLYSITNYIDQINAPLQIHQGLADDLVDPLQTEKFVSGLKSMGKNVEYFSYPGADHNLSGSSWQEAASQSLQFFNKN